MRVPRRIGTEGVVGWMADATGDPLLLLPLTCRMATTHRVLLACY